MRALNDLAIYIVAAWKVANPKERLPTSGGALDAAIERVADRLPEEFKELLSFGDTRVSRRCYELATVMACARDNELISDPNPKYISSEVAINEGAAKRLLKALNVNVDGAKDFAVALRDAVQDSSQSSETLHDAA